MAKILLVEDALELAESIRRELTADGHQVTLATDGKVALGEFRNCAPDLIILDWMLPELDGLAVLRQVREVSSVPVLMLSARSEATDRVIGLEVGADDYLTKPFNNRELLARIHALLRRMDLIHQTIQQDRQPVQSVLAYGAIHLDPDTRLVVLNETELDLTRLEFDLLALFMGNPGRVFSRAYLIETVWDEAYLPGDRSVDNAILRLRNKLDMMGDSIETVWGVGYRLRKEQ
ncbi:MAG: response regulator transcription factor [Anaerolineaceae bacterium]|nr:response regulator transcription factor [Anaerolineaceae bacterium]